MPSGELSAIYNPEQARQPTPRFNTIDLLRGLSILVVILLHVYLSHEFVVIEVTDHYPKLQVTHYPGPLLAWAAATVAPTLPVAWLLARFVSEPLSQRLLPKHSSRSILAAVRSSRLN